MAIETSSKAIELDPKNAEMYLDRASAYLRHRKEYSKAIKDYNKVIELKPDMAEAYSARGVVYYKLGNYQQAIADFKIAARLGYKLAQDALLELGEQWQGATAIKEAKKLTLRNAARIFEANVKDI